MAGGFTCPHCRTFNRCNCKNCKETYDKKGIVDDFVKWDDDGELLICSKCDKKFHEDSSLEIEWNEMLDRISKILTKDICFEWILIVTKKDEVSRSKGDKIFLNDKCDFLKQERELYKKYNYGEEWFNRMFFYHFKISSHVIRKEGISAVRDIQINKIMDNGNKDN